MSEHFATDMSTLDKFVLANTDFLVEEGYSRAMVEPLVRRGIATGMEVIHSGLDKIDATEPSQAKRAFIKAVLSSYLGRWGEEKSAFATLAIYAAAALLSKGE